MASIQNRMISHESNALFSQAGCGLNMWLAGDGGSSTTKSRRCRRPPSRHVSMKGKLVIRASSSSSTPFGSGGGSEIVDANMSVLKRRIERLRVLEALESPPQEWMEWEKSCYVDYSADVAGMMAGLQSQLLRMRPSVSLFILSLLLSAVPVSTLLLLRALLQVYYAF